MHIPRTKNQFDYTQLITPKKNIFLMPLINTEVSDDDEEKRTLALILEHEKVDKVGGRKKKKRNRTKPSLYFS
jgi:hypothetical protein